MPGSIPETRNQGKSVSAHFFLKFREQFTRATYQHGQPVLELVNANRATSFLSEPDALAAAARAKLDFDHVEVVNSNTEEVAC